MFGEAAADRFPAFNQEQEEEEEEEEETSLWEHKGQPRFSSLRVE